MLDRIRKHVPQWLRSARWHASDLGWQANWRAIRAAATPWARPAYEQARARLFGDLAPRRDDIVIARDLLDGWLRDAAPPGVPFDAVVLETGELRKRFGDGPLERRSLHMHGKLRMTHRSIPSPSVLVLVLFSDVAADYFVESMAADVASHANQKYGEGVAFADSQASIPVLLKEVATAAGLGTIGKNALFFSRRFGFNCKLNVVFLNAPVDRYDPTPVGDQWKLPDCSTCNLCVEACPVGAFDDYVITRTESCDRLISGDFFGPRRDHMCRACITRCPVLNGCPEAAPHRRRTQARVLGQRGADVAGRRSVHVPAVVHRVATAALLLRLRAPGARRRQEEGLQRQPVGGIARDDLRPDARWLASGCDAKAVTACNRSGRPTRTGSGQSPGDVEVR